MEKDIPLGRIARPDDITKVIAFLASEKSKNITGQIIKVDGGRSLTSSGYCHYKGIKNMNTRFEPDGEKISSWLGNLINFSNNNVEIPKEEKELKKFIEQKMKESNFSTNLEDAHKNNFPYKNVDNNDQKLNEKYLQGKNPNPLYDLKEKNQFKYGKTVYNSSNNTTFNNTRFPIKQNKSYNINKSNYINQIQGKSNNLEEPMDSVPKYKINTNLNNNRTNIINNYDSEE